MDKPPKIAVIAGAGPAGLTAALELFESLRVEDIYLRSCFNDGGSRSHRISPACGLAGPAHRRPPSIPGLHDRRLAAPAD
jgi:succinate dehydrogenase/fumarate reductase flavoprotein subunit